MHIASGQNEGDPLPENDDSEGPSTLPRPELNPLLNSILGQNLGRWAEVYFTNPPETREQAVQELLRELEAQQREDQQSAQADISFEDQARSSPVAEPHSGGAILAGQTAGSEPLLRAEAMDPQTWSTDHLPRDRSAEEGFATKIWHSRLSTAPRRRYLLAGLAFAILGALVLAYMMRGGAPAPSAISAAAQRTPALPSQPASPAAQSGGPADNSRQGSSPSAALVSVVGSAVKPRRRSDPTPTAGSAGTLAATPPRSGTSPEGGGSEELALAKSYLKGNAGKERNSAEAAKWLWKAVAKQNAEATGLLATMYLEGDGIAKNCDQARLLLEAAARKGVQGAGDRLGHLQDFGCQ